MDLCHIVHGMQPMPKRPRVPPRLEKAAMCPVEPPYNYMNKMTPPVTPTMVMSPQPLYMSAPRVETSSPAGIHPKPMSAGPNNQTLDHQEWRVRPVVDIKGFVPSPVGQNYMSPPQQTRYPTPPEAGNELVLSRPASNNNNNNNNMAQPEVKTQAVVPINQNKQIALNQNADRERMRTSRALQDHIIVLKDVGTPGKPSDGKKYACQHCGRTFFRKSDLIRHIQIHLGIKTNVCHICGKRFVQRSALTVHLRVHSGEKPYSCPICHRAFSDSSSLARHRRIHIREANLKAAEEKAKAEAAAAAANKIQPVPAAFIAN